VSDLLLILLQRCKKHLCFGISLISSELIILGSFHQVLRNPTAVLERLGPHVPATVVQAHKEEFQSRTPTSVVYRLIRVKTDGSVPGLVGKCRFDV